MKNPLCMEQPEMLENDVFFSRIIALCQSGFYPLCLFGSQTKVLYCVLGYSGKLEVLTTSFPPGNNYSSLSVEFPAFLIFERLLYEEYGLEPLGHPWLKPVRCYKNSSLKTYPFFSSKTPLLHEVGVGPVHAGVIEPGHFRFSCCGEKVEYLEIQLGYQHRGVEKLFTKGDIWDKVSLAESIAGDTAIGHSLAYCSVVESLTDTIPAAMPVRIIALELERIAMHLSVLSALAGDVAYIMGQNLFAALRTTVINSSLALCGSRFGKRWLCPGGVNYGISAAQKEAMQNVLTQAKKQIIFTAEAMLSETSVLSRFDDTGIVSSELSLLYGFTGVIAKAAGLALDVRKEFPLMEAVDFMPVTEFSGDVYARAWVRYKEIIQSFEIVEKQLYNLPDSFDLCSKMGKVKPNNLAIAIVEGFRGRIVHVAKTDQDSETEFYRIFDPSLVNWQALAIAVQGEGISDFPLCNKSFDLSYCGSDL